ncbi:MAG: peptidoglycan/xylan/chitin deacetylase (PgdA/CDA1 family) [Oleiphilaceae bacterium]|jgi:peptidoglycan/xylan/chitin deacetylase (PgdA/CDA1 family)
MYYLLRQVIKKLLMSPKIVNLFWKNLPNGVYVYTYHRIGDKYATDYDRAVFSCTTEALEQQIIAINKNFKIITSEQLRKIVDTNERINDRYALITFDDGYLDNYNQAFPVLKKHKVPGIFYLPTDFIDSEIVPWWDEIAYLLRNSCNESYQLPEQPDIYFLDKNNIDAVIRKIISQAKLIKNISILEVLEDIRKNFPQALNKFNKLGNEEKTLFMNWMQAREMSDNGMEIGSHTMSHQILSQLSDKEQELEITQSKHIIEEKIGRKVLSIAYPVGLYNCYTEKSCTISKQADYIIGFNKEAGKNKTIANPYDIHRLSVDTDDLNLMKFYSRF